MTLTVQQGSMFLFSTPVSLDSGITLAAKKQDQQRAGLLTFNLPAKYVPFPALDVAGVTVEGNVRATKATIVGSMPLDPGASFTRSGSRMEVERVHATPESLVELHVRRIASDNPTFPLPFEGTNTLDVALIDQLRHTARLLSHRFSNGMMGAMVLPGAGVQDEIMQMGIPDQRESEQLLMPDRSSASISYTTGSAANDDADPTWRRNYRLSVVQWVPSGYYHVNAKVSRDTTPSEIRAARPVIGVPRVK